MPDQNPEYSIAVLMNEDCNMGAIGKPSASRMINSAQTQSCFILPASNSYSLSSLVHLLFVANNDCKNILVVKEIK